MLRRGLSSPLRPIQDQQVGPIRVDMVNSMASLWWQSGRTATSKNPDAYKGRRSSQSPCVKLSAS